MRAETTLQQYKEPLSPLAGPYGHPFHPIAVTLPLGAWSSSFVFDLMSRRSDEPRAYAHGSAELIKTGIVGALGAALFGFLDYLKIPAKTAASTTATTHLALNGAVLLLYTVNLAQREKKLHADETRDDPVDASSLGLSAVSLLMLAASGWLGGMLSYHFGVRVADEATQREGLAPT